MELLKLPAGRLATVFYKAEPQDFPSHKSLTSEDGGEKGALEEDAPPLTVESRRTGTSRKEFPDRQDHVFAWKNICLDIKSGEGDKRLLDDLDGK